jgi:integrase
MASLRRLPHSRFWIACFTGPDNRRVQCSTKETERKRAQKIADHFEEASRNARLGFLVERQARKVIGHIYRISNRETLPDETIKGYFTSWVERKKREAGRQTFLRYSGIVAEFLKWLGPRGAMGLQHLSSADIVGFRDHLAKKHSPASVNVARACIRAALYQAFRDGLVDVNEAARVEKLDDNPHKRQQRRAFTEDELRAILAVADSEWRGMVLCGAYTGMRFGDVSVLRWENVELAARELRFTTEKTGRIQVIPIAEPFHRYLLEIAGTDDPRAPLFPRAFALRQRDNSNSGLSNKFYRLLTKAGLVEQRTNKGKKKGRNSARATGGLGFHCLRHTATSLLKRAGASDVVAREIIGHDTAAVSRTYSHIDTATLRAAVDKLPDITTDPAS